MMMVLCPHPQVRSTMLDCCHIGMDEMDLRAGYRACRATVTCIRKWCW